MKLKPGVSLAAADAEIGALLQQFAKDVPDQFPLHFRMHLEHITDRIVTSAGRTLVLLVVAVVVLLVIGCANCSILLLARGISRDSELALRAALGATRSRIVRQLLVESLVLAIAGSLLGMLLAFWMARLTFGLFPDVFMHESVIRINLPILGFSTVLAIVSGVLFGLMPSLRISRPELAQTMQSIGRKVAGRVGRTGSLNWLIAAQVALTVVLIYVSKVAVIFPELEASRLDDDHKALQDRKVAVVGCGSLGSKLAVMLARAGVGNFCLVDDDLLLPDNFVRHDLDWRDVGSHKADSVANRIQLVNTSATCIVRKHRLGGQESSGSVESLIESLFEYDLLIDATAEPAVFNYLSAAATIGKKLFLWAEIFGGGFGGVIARHRPGIEPSPQSIRTTIENWCADRGQPIVRPAKRYDGGPDVPSVADDADVSVIAAHAARMAIDLLIPREPSSFPNSVYLIGLSKGWIFNQPFETYPIELGEPEAPVSEDDDDPDLAKEEAERIIQLFIEYKNATAPAEPPDQAPAD